MFRRRTSSCLPYDSRISHEFSAWHDTDLTILLIIFLYSLLFVPAWTGPGTRIGPIIYFGVVILFGKSTQIPLLDILFYFYDSSEAWNFEFTHQIYGHMLLFICWGVSRLSN